MKSSPDSRDDAGRALYEERLTVLPGLGQPPAPEWEDLHEVVRERWRGHAEQEANRGERAVAPRDVDEQSPRTSLETGPRSSRR